MKHIDRRWFFVAIPVVAIAGLATWAAAADDSEPSRAPEAHEQASRTQDRATPAGATSTTRAASTTLPTGTSEPEAPAATTTVGSATAERTIPAADEAASAPVAAPTPPPPGPEPEPEAPAKQYDMIPACTGSFSVGALVHALLAVAPSLEGTATSIGDSYEARGLYGSGQHLVGVLTLAWGRGYAYDCDLGGFVPR